MRRFLLKHRWATILVVGLMLFATSGATLSRMTCLMGGHTVLSFGLADDCCPEPESGSHAVLKATCCEFSEAKGATVTFIANNTLALVPVLMALDAVPVTIGLEEGSMPFAWLDSRPPPLSRPERLASIGSLRL